MQNRVHICSVFALCLSFPLTPVIYSQAYAKHWCDQKNILGLSVLFIFTLGQKKQPSNEYKSQLSRLFKIIVCKSNLHQLGSEIYAAQILTA